MLNKHVTHRTRAMEDTQTNTLLVCVLLLCTPWGLWSPTCDGATRLCGKCQSIRASLQMPSCGANLHRCAIVPKGPQKNLDDWPVHVKGRVNLSHSPFPREDAARIHKVPCSPFGEKAFFPHCCLKDTCMRQCGDESMTWSVSHTLKSRGESRYDS